MSQPLTIEEIEQLLKSATDVEAMWAKAQSKDSVEMLEYLLVHHPMPLEEVWQEGKLRMYMSFNCTKVLEWFSKRGFNLKPETDKQFIEKILKSICTEFNGRSSRNSWYPERWSKDRIYANMKAQVLTLIKVNPDLSKLSIKQFQDLAPWGKERSIEWCVRRRIKIDYEECYRAAICRAEIEALEAQKQALLDQIFQIDVQKQQLLNELNDLD